MAKKVWVVIAAYNEEKHIGAVIDNVKKFCSNIIVVDDGSRDKTFQIAKSNGVIALNHIVNMGKGAAVKTGCDFALKKVAGSVILVDADGQHDPKDIPSFLKALEGKDIVFGYRKFTKKMPFVFRFGNRFINNITKMLYGIKLRDTQCGYRALTAKAYKKVRWNANDYAMESEMIANAGKHKLKYEQVPIETIYSSKYKGTTPIDGVKIVLNMILWRLKLK